MRRELERALESARSTPPPEPVLVHVASLCANLVLHGYGDAGPALNENWEQVQHCVCERERDREVKSRSAVDGAEQSVGWSYTLLNFLKWLFGSTWQRTLLVTCSSQGVREGKRDSSKPPSPHPTIRLPPPLSDATQAVLPYLRATMDEKYGIGAYEAFLPVAHSYADAVEEGDAAELCNIDFSLAYGGKILLHNTRLRLLAGHRYGLETHPIACVQVMLWTSCINAVVRRSYWPLDEARGL